MVNMSHEAPTSRILLPRGHHEASTSRILFPRGPMLLQPTAAFFPRGHHEAPAFRLPPAAAATTDDCGVDRDKW